MTQVASVAQWEKTTDKITSPERDEVLNLGYGRKPDNESEAKTLNAESSHGHRPTQELNAESAQAGSKAVVHLPHSEMGERVPPLTDVPRVAAATGSHFRVLLLGGPGRKRTPAWAPLAKELNRGLEDDTVRFLIVFTLIFVTAILILRQLDYFWWIRV